MLGPYTHTFPTELLFFLYSICFSAFFVFLISFFGIFVAAVVSLTDRHCVWNFHKIKSLLRITGSEIRLFNAVFLLLLSDFDMFDFRAYNFHIDYMKICRVLTCHCFGFYFQPTSITCVIYWISRVLYHFSECMLGARTRLRLYNNKCDCVSVTNTHQSK